MQAYKCVYHMLVHDTSTRGTVHITIRTGGHDEVLWQEGECRRRRCSRRREAKGRFTLHVCVCRGKFKCPKSEICGYLGRRVCLKPGFKPASAEKPRPSIMENHILELNTVPYMTSNLRFCGVPAVVDAEKVPKVGTFEFEVTRSISTR